MNGNNKRLNNTSVVRLENCKNMVDYGFVHGKEGFVLNANVPDPGGSQSGATIATGFDLGARNKQDLINLGLGNDLVNKFTPYCGKKQYEAVEFLKKNPLSITKEEAIFINQKVKEDFTKKVEKTYNNSKGSKESGVKFFCLPKEAQTVIYSVYFQLGYLPQTAKNFWGYVTSQNWEATIKELRNFGPNHRYPTRRNEEADYLEGIFK